MKKLILLGCILGAATGAYAQNLVINGDFELEVPNNSFGNGWTASGNDGSGGWRSTGGNPGGTYFLNAAGSTTSNPYIEQVISVVVGERYRVAGDYARANVANSNNLDFAVQVDGNLWLYSVPPSPSTFSSFEEFFIASSSSVTLRLSGEWTGDSDPRVDNIWLEASPIPEPATMGLIAVGGAILAYKRRKRQ